jgi:hypothetical protein
MPLTYRSGWVCCSVCVPKDWPIEEIERQVNAESPTGLDHGWKVSDDPTFSSGQPNPCPCENDQSRLHYLMNC